MPRLKKKSVSKRKNERKLHMRGVRQNADTERFNIRPEDNGGSDYSGVLLVSDGGLARPAFAPYGPSVSNSCLIASDSNPKACKKSSDDSDIVDYNKSFSAQFLKSSENDCLKTHTNFDEAFAEAFPNIVVKRQSKSIEVLHKSKVVANKRWNENNETLNCDSHFEIMDTDHQIATQPLPLSWNAYQIMFGSFHQNDERFADQSRGFQCTCNALCMLVHNEIQSSSVLDQILYDGDALYISTVNSLKAEDKFVRSLLSLEEIPDIVEIKTGQYCVEKQLIRCGTLVNTSEDEALPTLHCALETAFLKSTSVLLITGAICSAISKRNNLYVFFDSHSHEENGLSSSDGTSILMSFSCLEDLIAYLYAFYESMRIDLTMQFDLLPISIRKNEHSCSHEKQTENLLEGSLEKQPENLLEGSFEKQPERLLEGSLEKQPENLLEVSLEKQPGNLLEGSLEKQPENLLEGSLEKQPENLLEGSLDKQPENLLEGSHEKQPEDLLKAYFHDQTLRQQRKAVITKKSESILNVKKRSRKEYYRTYRQNVWKNSALKAKELVANQKRMHKARQDRDYKARELVANRKHMHKARQDRDYKARELVADRKHKQIARQDRDYKAKELAANRKHMHKARQDRDYKARELVADRKHKQIASKIEITNQKN